LIISNQLLLLHSNFKRIAPFPLKGVKKNDSFKVPFRGYRGRIIGIIILLKIMCGIIGVFDLKVNHMELRTSVLKMSKKVRHRGPDWSGIFCCEKAILAHERLAIVDPQSGGQPLKSKDGNLILAVNGEIYNHQEIRNRYENSYEFQTQSDCEVILPLYRDKRQA